MRDSRAGQSLWSIWEGEGYEPKTDAAYVFYTDAHVDIENEVVRRALASAIQREGLVFSLGNGYGSIDTATVTQGYCGYLPGERDLTVCDEDRETPQGDLLDYAILTTWVELQ
jgi:ABC-type transport system substrate-binding protein